MYNSTLIKLCIFFIVGILLGFYVDLPVFYVLGSALVFLILFVISFLASKKNLHQNPLFGILVFIIFSYAGFLSSYFHLPKNNSAHFTNFNEPEISHFSPLIIAEVSEVLKPGVFQDRYILKVVKWNLKDTEGKLLLNISRDSISQPLEVGQLLATPGSYQDIASNLNPYQFDYEKYMKTLGVYKQINVSNTHFQKLASSSTSLRFYAGKIRDKISNKLKKQNFSKDELGVIQALLLGQRQELSSDIQQNYAAAGVIHILAVSGLHVGIILYLLNYALKWMERWRYGKSLKTVILLIALWAFAFIAGLSPSVVRAVSMFSFVAIGMQLERRTNLLNTLFASLLILLLINPLYIFQVGFQLSYAAVFAIVVFQPHIIKLIKPKNGIFRYLWKIVSVTLAAQIGVLPLSLYYFHQFPGLFLFSNIVILPFMGLMLGAGIILIFLLLIGVHPVLFSETYARMISFLNNFVAYIASKEAFLIKDITFSLFLCIAFCLLLVSISFLLKKSSFHNFISVLSAIILIQLISIYEKQENSVDEFVIFHKNRSTHIGITTNNQLFYYTSNHQEKPAFISAYEIGNNRKVAARMPLKNLYFFAEKEILVIDSLGIYKLPNFNPKLILLTNSPKINLDRLISELKPEQIIADGSNYRNLINKWQKTAENKKIPFHETGEKGAFIQSVSITERN